MSQIIIVSKFSDDFFRSSKEAKESAGHVQHLRQRRRKLTGLEATGRRLQIPSLNYHDTLTSITRSVTRVEI